MASPREDELPPAEVLRREAEAERELQALVAESAHRLVDRCPECGALGSLEMVGGQMRCIDCDEIVARTAPLGGLGRK
jgi:hypothetical protein